MTEPSEKDVERAVVYRNHASCCGGSYDLCQKCAALASEFAAIRAEQSAKVERLRAERDEANDTLMKAFARIDAAIARAEAAEGQRDAALEALVQDTGMCNGSIEPIGPAAQKVLQDTAAAATARDARIRAEAMEEAAKLFDFHGNPGDGPPYIYEHEAAAMIRAAIAPTEGGK